MKKLCLAILSICILSILSSCDIFRNIVKYDVNFCVDEIVTTYKVSEGSKLDVQMEEPSSIGYTFIGWEDVDGELIDIYNININQNYTLYPAFEANTYTITLDYGQSTSQHDIEFVEIQYGDVVELPIPFKDGSDFLGWYYEKICVLNGDIFEFDYDVTLTATFGQLKLYTVNFYDKDLQILTSQQITHGQLAEKPNDSLTIIEGYTFDNWYTSNSYEEVFVFDIAIRTDTDIYGRWTKENNSDEYKYQGTYYDNIDFNSQINSLKSQIHTLLQDYTKKSYDDLRWILEESDTIDYDIVESLPNSGEKGKFYLIPNAAAFDIYSFDYDEFNFQGTSAFNFQIVNSLPSTLNSNVYYLIKNSNNYDVYYNSTTLKYSIPYSEEPDLVWGIYDNSLILAGWPSSSGNIGSGVVGSWNQAFNYSREHVWPNSKLGIPRVSGGSKNQGSDAHNLRAIKQSINASRSNRYFDEVTKSYDPSTIESEAFYPGQAFVGDIARIFMYMDLMYEGSDNGCNLQLSNDASLLYDTDGTNYTEDGAYMGLLDHLVRWHEEDPVDSFEIRRNEIIYSIQGNRNPFIDLPELASLIYGNAIKKSNVMRIDYVELVVFNSIEYFCLDNKNNLL